MLFSPGRLELALKLFEIGILPPLPLSAEISDVCQILDSFFDWGCLILPHVWLREGLIIHFSKKARTPGVASSSHAHVLPLSLWKGTLHSHPDYHLAWQLGSRPVPRLNLGSCRLQVSLDSFPPPPPSRAAEQSFPKKHGT